MPESETTHLNDLIGPTEKSAGRHRRLFRAAAIGLGLALWLAIESALWIAGVGGPDHSQDPFVGFSQTRPLFTLNESETQYETAPSRLAFFKPQSFPATKAQSTQRVFCLGGSTVQGRPFGTETAFSTWLQINLSAADPAQDWQTVNCGGISYASYRLVPILQECLEYEPDLIILCTGHNEFLEDRSYSHIRNRPAWLSGLYHVASHSRVHGVLSNWFGRWQRPEQDPQRPVLAEEVDALLDYRGGLEMYQRDADWRAGVIEHYEFNLRRMIQLAKRYEIPLILIRPPSNLADCPPFKSLPTDGLTAEQRAEVSQLVREAEGHVAQRPATAASLYQQALQIDSQNAQLAYQMGKCLEGSNQLERARKAFRLARDLDVCPLRILSEMEESIERVARDLDVPLLDAQQLLTSQTPDGILGDYMLVDHIHPSIHAHELIANRLVEIMAEMELIQPQTGWEQASESLRRQHLGSLNRMYFLRGMRTLSALQAWTKGRVDGPPISKRRPASQVD